jgi:hypothetical protein
MCMKKCRIKRDYLTYLRKQLWLQIYYAYLSHEAWVIRSGQYFDNLNILFIYCQEGIGMQL